MIIPEDHVYSRFLDEDEVKKMNEGEWKNFDVLDQINRINYYKNIQ
jgi:hypothetical protein